MNSFNLLKKAIVCLLFVFPLSIFSQEWVRQMEDPTVNFYTVVNTFNNYWETHDATEKGKGWKAFKRWENFMAPRVYPSGNRDLMFNAIADYYQQKQQEEMQKALNPNLPTPQAGNWTLIGPTSVIPSSGGGAGRANCIRVDPSNPNVYYVGAPGGGLWKSTNQGGSWTMWNTDNLTAIGVTDIAIHPTNSQIMYLATGDGDAGDTYSIGVLKSTDGGVTWNTTGLNWTVTQTRRISKLLIDPSNPNTVHAATSNGMYRTTDGGTTWSQIQAGNFKDAELRPGTPATIYAVTTTTFYRSTNSGASYTAITAGLPGAGVNRYAIAVTPANNQYVYLLASASANNGFYGFYRSTDGGGTFTQITVTSPSNILGWASAGNDTGGQGWYDLALAASPTNANELVAGGVNIWRTTNGGSSWTLNGHWTGSGAPYVHADHHDLVYVNGTTVLNGNDGGLFRTTNNGGSWTDLSNGLQIAQMYRLGTSATVNNLNLSGWQDNGTNRVSGTTWTRVIGGDGMECIIDFSNANIMYGELYYGNIRKSTNGGASFTTIVNTGGTGVNSNGNWVTPYVMSPSNNQELLVGKGAMYKSTNGGTTWTTLGATTGGSGNMVGIAYAPSNTQIIYCHKQNAMFKSTNGGTSFTNITGTLPTTSAMTYVTVSNTDPNRVYVTYSGYNSANKVFMSTNGGTSWTNYSTGLPNLPVNCIVFQNGSPNGVYVGTDVGVYYRDDNQTTWVSYSTGLPNVIVNELEIQYGAGKIRAATYGRGMWESDLFSSGNLPPVADFTSNYTSGCPGIQIQFTDLTSFNPSAWSWSFPGGTPATSIAQNPLVTYNTPGTYQVTLTATNANGTDTETKTSYITISSAGPLPLVEGFQNATFPPANWLNQDAGGDAIVWARTTATGGYATSTACMWFDNYTLNSNGNRDEMWSPKYNLATVATCTLSFDVAYARYNAQYSDTLAVLVSTDCGQTFTQVWMQGGTTLATAPDNTNAFTPTATQWKTEVVNLNSYAGQATFMVVFQNRGRWGNNVYVDNINLQGTAPPGVVANFTASSTSICPNGCVNFTDNSTGNPTTWNWSFPGGTPATSTQQNPSNICYSTPGTYTVTLTASNGSSTSTSTTTITVNANPTVSSTPANPTICSGSSVTITASGATTYTWGPATGLSATTGASVIANPITTTTYTITGTTNGCSGTSTRTVTVNPLPTITATPAPATICAGGNVTLTAAGGTTYTWGPAAGLSATTGSSVVASPTATTTYTITGTGANGCTNTTTKLVTVNPLPTVTSSPASPSVCTGGNVTLTAGGASTYTWSPATGLSATTGSSVVATPTATTTYIITGTGANGCTNTTSQTVTVNPNPTVTASQPNPTICAGSSVSLSVTGATTYTWSPGTGLSATTGGTVTANPATTTSYTVTGTSGGCTSTTVITVTVNPSPGTPVITQAGNVLTCNPTFTTYQWYLNAVLIPGATNQSYTMTASGSYTVVVSNSFGCTATSAPFNGVLTGVPELNLDAFTIFPNPNNGQFDLILGIPNADDYTIEITNMAGQLVFSEVLSNFSGQYVRKMDISGNGKGVYMITVRNTQNQTVKKVIVF
jgi:PKD repeat protein